MKPTSYNDFIWSLVNIYKDEKRKLVFILGSGASLSSGIPIGSQMARDWIEELKKRFGNIKYTPIGTKLDTLCKSCGLEKRANEDSIDFINRNAGLFYADLYSMLYDVDPKSGFNYINKSMNDARPKAGYAVLAHLLANKLFSAVVTTNFDTLLEESVYSYTSSRPLVLGHESLADFADLEMKRPLILKVHGDRFLEPKSTVESLKLLPDSWIAPLRSVFDKANVVVIGYGGNDAGLMKFLTDPSIYKNSAFKCEKFFWCTLNDEIQNSGIKEAIDKNNGDLVTIKGFDELMVDLTNQIGVNLQEIYNELQVKQKLIESSMEQLKSQMCPKLTEDEISELHKKGVTARKDEKWVDGLECWNKILESNEQDHVALYQRAFVYGKLGDTRKALDDLNKAIVIYKDESRYFFNRGNKFRDLEEYQRAVDDFTACLEFKNEKDSDINDSYAARAFCLTKLGRLDEAEADLKQFESRTGNKHLYHYLLTDSSLKKLKSEADKNKILESIIKNNTDNTEEILRDAWVLYDYKKYDDALMKANKAYSLIDRQEEILMEALMTLYVYLMTGLGNSDPRHQTLFDRIESHATVRVYETAARLYFVLKKYSKSIEYGLKAVNLKSDDDTILNLLGAAYFENEQPDEALPYYEKALKLNPANDAANFNMGEYLERKGEKGFEKFYFKAYQLNPRREEFRKAYEKIKQML